MGNSAGVNHGHEAASEEHNRRGSRRSILRLDSKRCLAGDQDVSFSTDAAKHNDDTPSPPASSTKQQQSLRLRNRQIEEQLKRDALEEQSRIKILLLGGAETGKTTLFKQMRILHLNGFSDEDRQQYKHYMHGNIIRFVQQLLQTAKRARIVHEAYTQRQIHEFNEFVVDNWGDDDDDDNAKRLIPAAIGLVIARIWQCATVQLCYKRQQHYSVDDSTKYFLDNVTRITSDDYSPSHRDILCTRHKTTGTHQLNFVYKSISFLMVDVGGQKSERRKWIHCFDNVQLVLFVISLADFDLLDQDDPELNRLLNNLSIFVTVVRSEHFKRTSFTLFMNKDDVFRAKLTAGAQIACFDDYKGGDDYESALAFITGKFRQSVPTRRREKFFPFVTTATQTDNIQKVFSASVNHIIQKNLKATGLQL